MKNWIWWLLAAVVMALTIWSFCGCAGGQPMTYEQRMGLLYAAQGLQNMGNRMQSQSYVQPLYIPPAPVFQPAHIELPRNTQISYAPNPW